MRTPPIPYCPPAPPAVFPTCDLDDLAAAHTLAMVTKEAEGRYLLSERSCLHTELVDYCRWVAGCACVCGRPVRGWAGSG